MLSSNLALWVKVINLTYEGVIRGVFLITWQVLTTKPKQLTHMNIQ